jgi:tRNA-intron lyase
MLTIPIYQLMSGSELLYLIFDANIVEYLRSKTRIVGQLIGTTNAIGSIKSIANEEATKATSSLNFACKQQLNTITIPLQLNTQELLVVLGLQDRFLVDVHLIRTVELFPREADQMAKLRDLYESYMRKLNERRAREVQEARASQVSAMKSKILKGKRVKLDEKLAKLKNQLAELNEDSNSNPSSGNINNNKNSQLIQSLQEQQSKLMNELADLEENFERELEQLNNSNNKRLKLDENTLCVELFTSTPDFYLEHMKVDRVEIDSVRHHLRKHTLFNSSCKWRAYRRLWSAGYYLTCGGKFGADFLVYPGSPSEYHSQFMLICIEPNYEQKMQKQQLTIKQLITYARMATSVKKTLLLAYCRLRGVASAFNRPNEQQLVERLVRSSNPEDYVDYEQDEKELVDELIFTSVNWSHL